MALLNYLTTTFSHLSNIIEGLLNPNSLYAQVEAVINEPAFIPEPGDIALNDTVAIFGTYGLIGIGKVEIIFDTQRAGVKFYDAFLQRTEYSFFDFEYLVVIEPA